MLTLDSPLKFVKGVGVKVASILEKLSLYTVEDCFYFFPREYDDRRQLPKIRQCKVGQNVTIVVKIESINERTVKKKMSIIECYVSDVTGSIKAVWFNQAYIKKVLKIQKNILIKGKLEQSLFQQDIQLNVMQTELLHSDKDYKDSVGIVMPVYHLTYGLHQQQIRKLMKEVFEKSVDLLPETLPFFLLKKLQLVPLKTAIRELHFPTSVASYKQARSRFVFDEFFFYQLKLEKHRLTTKQALKTVALTSQGQLVNRYIENLPYTLTAAQQRVIKEIQSDLEQTTSMNRLLQGDVGAGKTDVAVITILYAIQSNKSGVMMAPTEILAVQHYLKLKQLTNHLGCDVCLLKSKMKKKEKEATLALIESQKPLIIVGTHALIEDYVAIPNLGVVVIDEQHRFGVVQREKLKRKGHNPHCLYMTATPIPRSFMLTCFGDLDKSIIDELPPGRIPPKTHVVSEEFLPHTYQSCFAELKNGRQIYMVYPLIEESEKIDLKSAEEGFETMKKTFPEYQIGLLHGRMSPDEKQSIMQRFKNNEIQLLVSTTVIEVGIDVPNATVMMIRHAERFGLSQLHQLRGRIGRGGNQSFCYLISDMKSENAAKRLKSMAATTDGFKIAEYDLMIRGPGDVLGTRQSGIPDFKMANLIADEQLLQQARNEAVAILRLDPHLMEPGHDMIKQSMLKKNAGIMSENLN
ncbi:DNA helicase RecG [Candidatus Marinamargulisbacteria bacterium SCGC AG-414-C22]|nr:DNA helicase RecG [Candidatus Marinamargulisbacteria bacterium SCGC AG-414-C22]